ncbi:hypothetical protein LJB78_00380 [Bacteroidales bacterium OttesenSCG-928-J16]|nr:hypothetical protein [Bacteroidales bacterium OttesenSCG-928-J16]
MVRKIGLLVVLTLLSWNMLGQNERSVSLRVDEMMSNEDYSNGKIIVTWTLSNNTTISNEINIGNIETDDVFKIIFPGTETEAALVVSTNIRLSFNDGAVFSEESFSGFMEFLECKEKKERIWILVPRYM